MGSPDPVGSARSVMVQSRACLIMWRKEATMTSRWDECCRHCFALPLGPVSETTDLERLLSACWDELGGANGGMEGHKLLGRMGEVEWTRPILSFTTERHGGTVMGSSRAEL